MPGYGHDTDQSVKDSMSRVYDVHTLRNNKPKWVKGISKLLSLFVLMTAVEFASSLELLESVGNTNEEELFAEVVFLDMLAEKIDPKVNSGSSQALRMKMQRVYWNVTSVLDKRSNFVQSWVNKNWVSKMHELAVLDSSCSVMLQNIDKSVVLDFRKMLSNLDRSITKWSADIIVHGFYDESDLIDKFRKAGLKTSEAEIKELFRSFLLFITVLERALKCDLPGASRATGSGCSQPEKLTVIAKKLKEVPTPAKKIAPVVCGPGEKAEMNSREFMAERVFQMALTIKKSDFLDRFQVKEVSRVERIIKDGIRSCDAPGVNRKVNLFLNIKEIAGKLELDFEDLSSIDALDIYNEYNKTHRLKFGTFKSNMKWIQAYIGLRSPPLECLVSMVPDPEVREKGQAPCFDIVHLAHFESVAVNTLCPKCVRETAAILVLMCYACLRTRDALRARILAIDQFVIWGECYKRKARDPKKANKKMPWVCSIRSITGSRWWEGLASLVNAEIDFLFPFYESYSDKKFLSGSLIRTDVRAPDRLIPKLMSVILKVPSKYSSKLPHIDIKCHTPRRFLNTCAEVVDLCPERAALIGRWAVQSKGWMSMSRRYSSATTTVTAQVQRHLIHVIKLALKRFENTNDTPSWNDLDPADLRDAIDDLQSLKLPKTQVESGGSADDGETESEEGSAPQSPLDSETDFE
jgi:hypothetical protein